MEMIHAAIIYYQLIMMYQYFSTGHSFSIYFWITTESLASTTTG